MDKSNFHASYVNSVDVVYGESQLIHLVLVRESPMMAPYQELMPAVLLSYNLKNSDQGKPFYTT